VNDFLSNKRCPCWRHGAQRGRENRGELVAAVTDDASMPAPQHVSARLIVSAAGRGNIVPQSATPSPPPLPPAAARKSALILLRV